MDTHSKTLSVFRSGRHTSMDGTVLEINEADLQQTVDAYQPALHEAPLVVGHPQHDAPAWGWVAALKLVNGELQALPRQVDPAFADLVRAGRYKKISASFYTPRSANNPRPGVYYLRHVGFLGAQPPAVKGLPDAAFRENEAGVVTIERTNPSPSVPGGTPLDAGAATATTATTTTMESEMPEHSEGVIDQAAQLQQRERELASREARFSEREAKLRHDLSEVQRKQSVDLVDRLIGEGRLLPRHRPGVIAFISCLEQIPDAAFSESEDGEEPVSALDYFQRFLRELPVHVDYSEHASERGGLAENALPAVPAGYAVDPAGLGLHRRILAHARANNTDYVTAAVAVGG